MCHAIGPVPIGHANEGPASQSRAGRDLELGQVDTAIKELREAIQLAPAFADAHYNLGSALLAQGNITDAIASYRRAIELDPDYAEAHNNLAEIEERVRLYPTQQVYRMPD